MHTKVKMTGLAMAAVAMTFTTAGCGDDGGEDVAGFCEKNEEFESESEQLFEGALSATDDAGLDDAKQAFSDANDLLSELADEAPDEIKDDVDAVADAFAQANEEIQGAESDTETRSIATPSRAKSPARRGGPKPAATIEPMLLPISNQEVVGAVPPRPPGSRRQTADASYLSDGLTLER